MPSSIPYSHPSLVLGNVVDTRVLGFLQKIDSCQCKVDAAQDKLNSLIMMRRSIAMTINELSDLNVDVSSIREKQSQLDSKISEAATDYLTTRMDNEEQIQQQREQLSLLDVQESLESPMDFGSSLLKSLPLSAESLKLDSQYFSFGSNLQDDSLANVEKFIRTNTSNLGAKSDEITRAVSSQVNNQLQNHNIAGTLIIMASCTHSNVKLFQPLVIDPDKAVKAWNIIKGGNAKIDTHTLPSGGSNNTAPLGVNDADTISIISGASYGSSFVGMVHVLKTDTTEKADLDKLKASLDEKLRIGGWLQNSAGGFGIDESMMSEVKSFLSTQSVASHVSIVTMGAVPSMKSNTLELGVKALSEPDTKLIKIISGETNLGSDTVSSEADKAKENARLIGIQNAKMQSLVKGLSQIDHQNNKILDINSMMNAFESYLSSVQSAASSSGVPINFYLTKLSKTEIEELWLNKYYPETKTDAATKEK